MFQYVYVEVDIKIMSKFSFLEDFYKDMKKDYKEVTFSRGTKKGKCSLCHKHTHVYDLYLRSRGNSTCGCKGKGCNSCREWIEDEFATVCSERCETMLILKLV